MSDDDVSVVKGKPQRLPNIRPRHSTESEASDETLRFAGATPNDVTPFCVDRRTYSVQVADANVVLTAAQFDLLAFLLDNRHRVVDTTEIAERVFGASAGDTSALVRVHICNLRRAIGSSRDSILTVRGRGYRVVTS